MSQIPTASRLAVKQRQRGCCFRCMLPGSQWHHRRRRAVRDEHRHCPCNGVWLCGLCHYWVHQHPSEATEQGLILASIIAQPFTRPMHGFDGWWSVDCTGRMTALADEQL